MLRSEKISFYAKKVRQDRNSVTALISQFNLLFAYLTSMCASIFHINFGFMEIHSVTVGSICKNVWFFTNTHHIFCNNKHIHGRALIVLQVRRPIDF